MTSCSAFAWTTPLGFAVIEELIQIADKSTDLATYGSKHLAIDLLGELRANESIRVLVNNLLFVPKSYSLDSGPPLNPYSYISAKSLLKIGGCSDATRILRDHVADSKSEEERHLAAWLIREMQGEKQAVAFLSEAAENSVGERQRNLNKTVSYLKNFKQTFGEHKYPRSSLLSPPQARKQWHSLPRDTTFSTVIRRLKSSGLRPYNPQLRRRFCDL